MKTPETTFAIYIESDKTLGSLDDLLFSRKMGIVDELMEELNNLYKRQGTFGYMEDYEQLLTQYPDTKCFIDSVFSAAASQNITDIIDHIAQHQFMVMKLTLPGTWLENSNEPVDYCAVIMFDMPLKEAPTNKGGILRSILAYMRR